MASEAWAVPGYTQVRELGAGAAGRLVLAVRDGSRTAVAIRYLSPELLGDPEFTARFADEVRLLAGTSDPYLVRYHGYVEDPRGAAIVMEAVDGVGLRRLLDGGEPVGPEAALTVLKASLLGLAAAHEAGVPHRDFRPENVLVDGEGAIKVADTGVAVRSPRATLSDRMAAYLAPERWTGEPATPAADVYAAAAVFYECLTGAPPFRGTPEELAEAHRSAPVPLTVVPEPLRLMIAHGMAKDPAARPPSASALLKELNMLASPVYGPGWERTGRGRLAEPAASLGAGSLLAGLPPASPPGTTDGGAPSGPRPHPSTLLTLPYTTWSSGIQRADPEPPAVPRSEPGASQTGAAQMAAPQPPAGEGSGQWPAGPPVPGPQTAGPVGEEQIGAPPWPGDQQQAGAQPSADAQREAGGQRKAGEQPQADAQWQAVRRPDPDAQSQAGRQTGAGRPPEAGTWPSAGGQAESRPSPPRPPARAAGKAGSARPKDGLLRPTIIVPAVIAVVVLIVIAVAAIAFRRGTGDPEEEQISVTTPTLPASPLADPGKALALALRQMAAKKTATFTYTAQAGAGNDVHVTGARLNVVGNGAFAASRMVNPSKVPGGALRLPGRVVLTGDRAYVSLLKGTWKSYPRTDIASGKLGSGRTLQVDYARSALDVVSAARLSDLTQILTETHKAKITRPDGLIQYAGKVHASKGLVKRLGTSPDFNMPVVYAYRLRLGPDYLPRALTLKTTTSAGKPGVASTVHKLTYADWGRAAPIGPPA